MLDPYHKSSRLYLNYCAGCPFIDWLERDVTAVQAERDKIVADLTDVMNTQADSEAMLKEISRLTGKSFDDIIAEVWQDENLTAEDIKQLQSSKISRDTLTY